ncbi:MAG: cytidylate kinase-like family protein [Clostridia bacterium]|nr:cytidylate kinase-like family protein [Clostridia bacterium]
MKIITISREFGSGGRELGKRLADILGFDYYDREIITAIAEKKGLDENYVENALENHLWQTVPLTYHHSFATPILVHTPPTELIAEQTSILERIAKSGKDCIIVGRNADFLLRKQKPLNLFVCAEMEEKIKRCMDRAEDEHLTYKQIKQKIKRIDRNRAKTRNIISGSKWGHRATYHLIVNTTDWSIKELAPAIAEYANRFFEKNK